MSVMPSLLRLMALPRRFLAWWQGELVAGLPWRGQRAPVSVVLHDGEFVFRRTRMGRTEGLGRCPLAADVPLPKALKRALTPSRPVELILPVLQRPVSLPLAAAENLREVIAFEMDRLTPFRAEAVLFDCQEIGRDEDLDRLRAQLFLLPRRRLDPLLQRLASLGLKVGALRPEDAPSVNLLAGSQETAPSRWLRPLTAAALFLAVAFLSAAVLLPLQARKAQLLELETRLAEARGAAFAADALKEKVATRLAESQFLIAKKQERLSTIALLDEVSRQLPDEAWLLHLTIKGEAVTLAGYAARPSALIGRLEASDFIGSVSFTAPIVMDPRVERERFTLQAQVLPTTTKGKTAK